MMMLSEAQGPYSCTTDCSEVCVWRTAEVYTVGNLSKGHTAGIGSHANLIVVGLTSVDIVLQPASDLSNSVIRIHAGFQEAAQRRGGDAAPGGCKHLQL